MGTLPNLIAHKKWVIEKFVENKKRKETLTEQKKWMDWWMDEWMDGSIVSFLWYIWIESIEFKWIKNTLSFINVILYDDAGI